jgi:peptide/nickel transport system permease protein
MVPTLFLVSLLVFLGIRLIPGSIVENMALEMGQRESTGGGMEVEEIERMLGLDVPVHVQYGRWIGGIITRGDFGDSLWSQRPVLDEIVTRLPVTFELGLLAFLIAQVIAIPIGIYSAIRQDTFGDFLGRTFAIINLATPAFWLATMIMVFPAIWWG